MIAEDMTEDFMSLVLEEMEFEEPPTAARSLGRDLVYPRNTPDPVSVWERPAKQYLHAKAKGKSDEEAISQMVNRAEVLATDDVNLAKRKTTQQSLIKTGKIKGYRRVIHPELSETGVCGLCFAASDRIYTTGVLLPIHARCKCEVLPIIGNNDPGRDLNLSDAYDLAGSAEAADLLKVNFKVTQNGELEGYLRRKEAVEPDYFEPPKPQITDRAKIEAQVKALEDTLGDLIDKAKSDPSYEAAVEWQQNRLNKLRKQLNG